MANSKIPEYELLEQRLIEKNAQFGEYCSATGIVGDKSIVDPKKRRKHQKAKLHVYQNTKVLLENYQTMLWVIQNFPDTLAEELNEPMGDLERLLDRVDLELSMEKQRVESRLRSIAKSKALIDRVNTAITVLRTAPVDGEDMYQIIYQTYINPTHRDVQDLYVKLSLTKNKYYSLREKAFKLISLALWSGPTGEISQWMEIITMIEEIKGE